ncbi:hypothetical protein [Anaerolinea sp.]|uniref:hypothetical protein n=1 Tax=Anaerolinea sp. TaxID=1872519 RepID=UPI002ACEC055|nr:hypothetical protein [Anaerolinea sp.]
MKLHSFTLAALVMLLIFGGIGLSTAMNWWHTETTKVVATFTEGEFAGLPNPADIRGSYTFGDVVNNFEISLNDLAIAFRLPADVNAASFQVKDLESLYEDLPVEVGTASVRMFVAFYLRLPYDLSASEDTYLFPEAAAILQARGNMLPEQAVFLESHIVPETAAETVESAPQSPATSVTPTPDPTEHTAPERTITGKTTFQELLDWGVTQETIESLLGGSMPDPATPIKDYVVSKGLEFSSLKTKLQEAVNQVK